MKNILAIRFVIMCTFFISFCSSAPTDEADVRPSAEMNITPTEDQGAEKSAKTPIKVASSTLETTPVPEYSATPTIKVTTSTPKPTSAPDIVVFDSADANTIVPEDVLEEIRYFAGGGP